MNKLILALFVTVSLTACRNDGGESISNSKTGKLDGQVKAMSVSEESFQLNGYRLQASGAEIRYRQHSVDFARLDNGMRVQADAVSNNVSSMKLDPSMVGEVDYVKGNRFSVNGVELEYSDLRGVKAGDWVMVTTYPQVDGTIEVVSVQLMPEIGEVEMEGFVERHQGYSFTLNGIEVDYSNATLHGSSSLKNGHWVEVFGDMVNNGLRASEIYAEDYSKYDDVEIEGLVTWVNSDITMFQLNNHLNIAITDRTEFDDGKRSDLEVGRWVEVELLYRNGRLIADEVEFEDDGDFKRGKEFEVEGRAVHSSGSSVFTINDIEIDITSRTDFDDDLSINNLNGEWVEVEGRYINDRFVAYEIEREDKDDDIELEGPVSNGQLWGYEATDGSLDRFNGRWVEVDCDLDGTRIVSNCDD